MYCTPAEALATFLIALSLLNFSLRSRHPPRPRWERQSSQKRPCCIYTSPSSFFSSPCLRPSLRGVPPHQMLTPLVSGSDSLSSVEAAMSIIWIRIHETPDGISSIRVCGREVKLKSAIDSKLWGPYFKEETHVENSKAETTPVDQTHVENGKVETTPVDQTHVENGKAETTPVEHNWNISLVPTLMVRRFNPEMSLGAPAGLVDNVRVFFKPRDSPVRLLLEHGVHVIVGLMDVSLGVAGLALKPRSPEALYTALKDPKAPLTFENYSTLFLLYWLLGAVLFICMLPTRLERKSVKMIFGLPGGIALVVASLASVVLFVLGCWKIDVARKAHEDWTPMLSYWIGGATAIPCSCNGLEIFHIFGLVGLVGMLKHTF